MSKKNKKNQNDEPKAAQEEVLNEETVEQTQENVNPEADDPEKKIADLEAALEHEKKEYLFLMADFENFRKRTLKEKADLIKNGAESAMRDLLPVVDDLERALDAINKVKAESKEPTGIYTLTGNRIPDGAALRPGIYIQNGKKRIIK